MYIFLSYNNQYCSENLNKALLHMYLQNNEAIWFCYILLRYVSKNDHLQNFGNRSTNKEKAFVIFHIMVV